HSSAVIRIICLSLAVYATTLFYTLSLHDALPILHGDDQVRHHLHQRGAHPRGRRVVGGHDEGAAAQAHRLDGQGMDAAVGPPRRSEEHTSELQSRENLVCRLLLEKKNLNSIHTYS